MHYRKGRFPCGQCIRAERTAPPMAGRAAAMRPARERRLAGPRRPGKAARGELGEGNTPVLPGPPKADSPAYCRLPSGANMRLLALSRGLPYRVTAELGGNVWTIGGTPGSERRYKARPCGPTNRAAAAAGRRGRRTRRWGERPPVLPAHTRRKAGLAAAHGRYLVV